MLRQALQMSSKYPVAPEVSLYFAEQGVTARIGAGGMHFSIPAHVRDDFDSTIPLVAPEEQTRRLAQHASAAAQQTAVAPATAAAAPASGGLRSRCRGRSPA